MRSAYQTGVYLLIYSIEENVRFGLHSARINKDRSRNLEISNATANE